jgi:hypothetical protein
MDTLLPTSAPCWLRVVGSWMVKKTSSRSLKAISAESKVIWIASAWPVVPLHTYR